MIYNQEKMENQYSSENQVLNKLNNLANLLMVGVRILLNLNPTILLIVPMVVELNLWHV